MTFIWSPEAIENLLQHQSPEVQRWAIDKALELYPNQLCDRVIALLPSVLPSAPASISWLVLRCLAELDFPITNLDPLVEVSRLDAETGLKSLAGAILLRSGYALLPREIESGSTTLYADVVASTERGFDLVLQAYREFSGKSTSILDGIAHVCNFADLHGDLADETTEKGIKESIDYFCQLWECNDAHLEQLSEPEGVLSALDRALTKAVPAANTPRNRGLLAELEYDRTRLRTLREIAGERASRWSKEERRFLLACTLCLWRNEACWRRLIEATNMAELWKAIVMKPWRGVHGQALKDFLLSTGPEELLHSLSAALRQDYSYASCAFDILNTIDTPGRFELFLDVYEGKKYEGIIVEEAGEALKKAGAPAVEFIIEHYPGMSPSLRTLVLFILDSFPTSKVVDFCLKHFDEYMCGLAPQEFVDCLGVMASSRFLPLLLQEWREGETGIGSTIKLISEINNIKDEKIDSIIQDTEKRTRHLDDGLAKPISSFPLRCTKCGRTYEYEVRKIYVGKGGSPVIGDIIQCKGCGSIETYEMTAYGQFKVTAELVRIAAVKQAHKEEDSEDSPVKVYGRFDMTTLSRKIKSMGEGYRLLKSEIENKPQDANLQRRMGNLLKNGGKPDLAMPYYLEAIRLKSDDAESYYNIVDIIIKRKQYEEAIPYLERLVPTCRDCKMDERLRRDIFSAVLQQTYIIENETGHKVDLFVPAKPEGLAKAEGSVILDVRPLEPVDAQDFERLYHMFRYGRVPSRVKPDITIEASRTDEESRRVPVVRGNIIGRNAPCPCGSGKKYKKCCGR